MTVAWESSAPTGDGPISRASDGEMEQIGEYIVRRLVGEGGMGRVYEAVDLLHELQAAVKVISRRLARDLEFRARFQREAQAAERANHPHVLPIWDYGAEGENLYIAKAAT